MEQWLRDNNLHEFGAQAALDPIIQASQLLQARKTDTDVDSVCDMCSRLSAAQVTSRQGGQGADKVVRLAPNGTNLGLVKISFSELKLILKSPRFVTFRANLTQFGCQI